VQEFRALLDNLRMVSRTFGTQRCFVPCGFHPVRVSAQLDHRLSRSGKAAYQDIESSLLFRVQGTLVVLEVDSV